MKQEIIRITKLLEEKKISNEEYSNLLKSLKNNQTEKAHWTDYLFNPFSKLTIFQSVLLSLSIFVFLTLVGHLGGLHYPGTFDIKIGNFSQLSFLTLLLQNLMIVVVISFYFLLGGLAYRWKNVRVIDVVTSVSLSRFPYVIASLFLIFYLKVIQGSLDDSQLSLLFFIPVILACIIWSGALYYKALKFSLGMSKRPLVVIFVVGLVLSEATTLAVNRSYLLHHLQKGTEIRGEQKDLLKNKSDKWLKLIDQEKYAESWEATSTYFQKVVSQKEWSQTMKSEKNNNGKLLSRVFFKIKKDPDNDKIVSVLYKSEYTIMGPVIEKVVFKNQRPREWKISGYWLK